jgi:glucosamine--fructose-6-phosphate aminotransferase (isomerizing)
MPRDEKKAITLKTRTPPPRQPWMLREIHEEPERVETLIARESERLDKALARFRHDPPPLILVAGRGTSDNAAVFGRYLFEHFVGIPVSGAALSLFTLYPAPMHIRGALSIGVSQSGESPDVVKALEEARRAGAFTLAVTNAPRSSLAQVADHTIQLHAREERAVAATKTFTCELVAMAMICRAMGGDIEEAEIASIADAIRDAVACEDAVAEVAPYYRYAPRFVCLARGFNYATARETALKLMETCYIGSSGMSAADFLHGPIAFVERDTPVLLFAPHGPTHGFMVDLAKRLRKQEVDVLAFTDREAMLRHCTLGIRYPTRLREGLSPIPLATLGQLFACHLALVRGLSPDAPRRLRKVTRTL